MKIISNVFSAIVVFISGLFSSPQNISMQNIALSNAPIVIGAKYSITIDGEATFIGKDNPTFTPEITMYRFGDETYLKLLEPTVNNASLVQKNASSTTNGTNYFWGSKDIQFDFYPMLDPGDNVSGAFEYKMIIANSKAGTNAILSSISFPIQSQGLSFYYQPPLTANETADGAIRPLDVVGSYAVYYSKAGDFTALGGKNYRVGKAFHIYRPKLIDNAGSVEYASMNITGSQLIIDFSGIASWLNKAKYPVVIDPTFGYTTAGASNHSLTRPRTQINATYLHTGAIGETITALYSYSNGAHSMAVYSIASGLPNSRLATAVSTSGSGTGWYSVSVSQNLVAGTVYGVAAATSFPAQYYDNLGGSQESFENITETLPATWSSQGTTGLLDSIYAVYSVASTFIPKVTIW